MSEVGRLQHDERFMAAALRYGRWHSGQTGTNPSVSTLLVDFERAAPRIVGRGLTALGGRPHAERIAIDQAGEQAVGTTAYVTLEPCAHHGVTPPCAQALIDAKVARVVTAYVDPDRRVDGEGHAMLAAAGIEISQGVLSSIASYELGGYLTRSVKGRPLVHLKLALSADNKLGIVGKEVPITGEAVRRQVHLMRAEANAVLVGAGTLRCDDPDLTCRLPAMDHRSPLRIVVAGDQELPLDANIFQFARQTPTLVVGALAEQRPALQKLGVDILGAENTGAGVPWPELLDDLGSRGIATLLVEGGAGIARTLLASELADRITLFQNPALLGDEAIVSPVSHDELMQNNGYVLHNSAKYGADQCVEFVRTS
jgi:diaminohydroxyphosphoribosylaminopyrimidine deaminase/5-amino-6-(5-phosphoribosylamino)uracil reductase